MNKFRFLDWQVYQDAQDLFIEVSKVVASLSQESRYVIGSQLSRAALSVVLNIAEGSGKTSDKELNRFFEIALGSLYETLAAIDTLEKMASITPQEKEIFFKKVEVISSQIGGFKKKLK